MRGPLSDPFDLARFVSAQEAVYLAALAELEVGRKRSHWMWFVFPQLSGLGHSPMALRYGIGSLDEARAYCDHPLLGPRLSQCTRAVLGHPGAEAVDIFGTVDALKFRSSMTLFEAACGNVEPVFAAALAAFYGGARDERTLALLA